MITKLFELRDRGTFVPVMVTKIVPANEQEHYLVRRCGYELPSDLVIMSGLDGGIDKATCDPFDWRTSKWPAAHQNRTCHFAHVYIAKHFDELESGAVIDVEFILGETAQPKLSEAVA